ncbi:type II toxin-antitoxin system HicB family antitoxin [Marinihelvus fidelis]|uniref:Type II toxin-antitoxin system HicB family antitoxin n=1 Tax=Marinihelvus fidelis TaxID=2613842 RepID=A0A5N0T982_9GAMM|nr:type II toxin-antitoxin system HicB family antitoxin [Marinihelvus fidelis]KAA9131575.1 type II toxin-antitoxin system HicB family antitoxin [Marinihelvus fidelis]
MKYTVIIEKSGAGFSGYVPDLPVVVAAGATREEVLLLLSSAIPDHIALMREDGDPVPVPTTSAVEIEVAA